MRKLLAVLTIVGFTAGAANAELIVGWDFAGLSGTTVGSVTANVSAVNMADPSDMFVSRGAGLVPSSNTGGYAANNWHSDNPSLTTAIASNNYFQFTVLADDGFMFSVTNVVWNMRRSGTGPSEFVLRSDVDGFTADLASWSETVNTVGLMSALNIVNQEAVTFRLYGFGGTSAAGSMNLGGTGNDFEFWGTTAVIPEPGTIALMLMGFAGMMYLRRRKHTA